VVSGPQSANYQRVYHRQLHPPFSLQPRTEGVEVAIGSADTNRVSKEIPGPSPEAQEPDRQWDPLQYQRGASDTVPTLQDLTDEISDHPPTADQLLHDVRASRDDPDWPTIQEPRHTAPERLPCSSCGSSHSSGNACPGPWSQIEEP
jgi:hypothetical protein